MSQVREAVELIVRECKKQNAKGYTSKHDDQHTHGELVMASACYAMNRPGMDCPVEYPWPEFDNRSKHNIECQTLVVSKWLRTVQESMAL